MRRSLCLRRLAGLALAWLLAGCGPAAAPVGTATPALPTAAVAATPTAAIPTTTRPPPSTTAAPTQPPPTAVSTETLTPAPSATSEPDIELLFTGDINPARCVYAIAQAANDMTLPYQGLAPLLQGADLTIGSLDGSLSDYTAPAPCDEAYRNLMGPSAMADGLAFAGYDVITVATNHAKDCGIVRGCVNDAFLDTLANLRARGIAPAGGGRNLAEAMTPAILTVQGVRFAFLGVTGINAPLWATASEPGVGPFKTSVYTAAIQQARQIADVVIVLPHWGREFSGEISYTQREGAQAMVNAGATLVIGNHPHRVQGVETFANGAVAAYSLGNFVFDMQWSDGTLYTVQGIMVRARFHGAQLAEVTLLPIHIYDNFQPRLADADEAAQILADVADSMASAP
ncbi:MAG: CapA family protein [Anaerolineales bacterium]|nr:CapA family protein [Anaerolineales bacterium]